jgi:ABC-type transport system involved in multi-copper enzyme maturation permease subunit
MPIFDQGYQHWQGPLSGHAWRWLAITRHGVRVQMKNRLLRILVLFAWIPALALVVATVLWGLIEQHSEGVLALVRAILPRDVLLEPQAYRQTIWTLAFAIFFQVQMFFIMLLVVIAGPGLISRDLRFNALPLYFSRPLTRLDYFLGKLGVIGAVVAAVAVVPAVFAYFVGVAFCLDLSVVRDTYPVLVGAVAYGVIITLSVGTLMLAMSSLTRRSLYVGIAWAGLWLISGTVAQILTEAHQASVRRGLSERTLASWVAEHPPPPGVRLHGNYPTVRVRPGSNELEPSGVAPEHQAEASRWYRQWQEVSQRAWLEGQAGRSEALRSDWRPLCSYVSNLQRIGDQLLGTDGAWVSIGKAIERPRAAMQTAFGPRGGPAAAPPVVNERALAEWWVGQYPWQWSAGVLAALVGLSTWTLTRRVKSLDRLR